MFDIDIANLAHAQLRKMLCRRSLRASSSSLNMFSSWIYGIIRNMLKLKACVRYFSSNFYFSSNDSPSKIMKNVFSSKKLFSSLRYLNFCIFVFPSFFQVSHCFRGWSKKNLKTDDVIDCLNKNLITHFVDNLRKK